MKMNGLAILMIKITKNTVLTNDEKYTRCVCVLLLNSIMQQKFYKDTPSGKSNGKAGIGNLNRTKPNVMD